MAKTKRVVKPVGIQTMPSDPRKRFDIIKRNNMEKYQSLTEEQRKRFDIIKRNNMEKCQSLTEEQKLHMQEIKAAYTSKLTAKT